MTEPEWDELLVWFEQRWPHNRWSPATIGALFDDLEKFDAVDVWGAVHHLYEQGREHPPSPSTIVARTLDERRQNALRERMAMPKRLNGGPDPDPPVEIFWPEYAERTYGDPISFAEAIQLEHLKVTDCRSPLCDLHRRKETA